MSYFGIIRKDFMSMLLERDIIIQFYLVDSYLFDTIRLSRFSNSRLKARNQNRLLSFMFKLFHIDPLFINRMIFEITKEESNEFIVRAIPDENIESARISKVGLYYLYGRKGT